MFYFGKETFRNYAFTSCIKDGEYIWFTTIHVNALFRLSLLSKETELVAWLPGESEAWDYYGVAGKNDNSELILFPHNAESICIYDIKTGGLTTIPLPYDHESDRDAHNKFTKCVICDQDAFFFPGRYPDVIKMNLETHIIERNCIMDKIPLIKDDNCIYIWDALKTETGFLLSCAQSNDIVEIVSDGSINPKHIVSDDLEGFSSIMSLDGKIYISHKTRNLITIYEDENTKEISLDNIDLSERPGIKYLFSYRNQLYIVPMLGDKLIQYNPADGSMKKFCDLNLMHNELYKSFQVDFVNNVLCCEKISENEILLFSLYDLTIAILNMDTQACRSIEARFNDIIVEEIDKKSNKDKFSCEYYKNALHLWIKGLNR